MSIGPYCVVGRNVVLGDGCRLIAHVQIDGPHHDRRAHRASIRSRRSARRRNRRATGAAPTTLVIGADCDIRENVTMNTGTEDGGGVDRRSATAASSWSAPMSAHDCRVGNDVIFANNAVLGGHVTIGDSRVPGRAGRGAPVRAHRRGRHDRRRERRAPGRHSVRQWRSGSRAALRGLNVVGMRRAAVRAMTSSGCGAPIARCSSARRRFGSGVDAVEREFGDHPLVGKIVAFMRAPRQRPLMMPAQSDSRPKRPARTS